MNGGERNIMDELLVKYLLGEATEAEQKQVQQWLKESEDNKKYFAGFKLIWNESRNLAANSTVDTDAAWDRFLERTQEQKPAAVRRSYRWAKIAAGLLLLAGGSWLTWHLAAPGPTGHQTVASAVPSPAPVNKQMATSTSSDALRENEASHPYEGSNVADDKQTADGTTHIPTSNMPNEETTSSSSSAVPATKVLPAREPAYTLTHHATKHALALKSKAGFNRITNEGIFRYDRTKEFICNSTPCPIEICIVQTVKCGNGEPSAISTCSVLEPDESGQLRYKAFDKITKNCQATVDEIRIKRISTGETIILNADSKPATAQEFFSYITGQKKGDITAGIFHTDCENNKDECGLLFDNSKLILQ